MELLHRDSHAARISKWNKAKLHGKEQYARHDEINRDFVLHAPEYGVFGVADGHGPRRLGILAARAASMTFAHAMAKRGARPMSSVDVQDRLYTEGVLDEMQESVLRVARRAGPHADVRTTFTGVVLTPDSKGTIFHIGDGVATLRIPDVLTDPDDGFNDRILAQTTAQVEGSNQLTNFLGLRYGEVSDDFGLATQPGVTKCEMKRAEVIPFTLRPESGLIVATNGVYAGYHNEQMLDSDFHRITSRNNEVPEVVDRLIKDGRKVDDASAVFIRFSRQLSASARRVIIT